MKTEIIIGNLLRAGVIISAVVTLAGGILYLIQYSGSTAGYAVFCGTSPELCAVSGIIKSALRLDSKAIIQTGVLLLLATPFARVLFSVIIFVRQRDYTYIIVSLTVLTVLMYSMSR